MVTWKSKKLSKYFQRDLNKLICTVFYFFRKNPSSIASKLLFDSLEKGKYNAKNSGKKSLSFRYGNKLSENLFGIGHVAVVGRLLKLMVGEKYEK